MLQKRYFEQLCAVTASKKERIIFKGDKPSSKLIKILCKNSENCVEKRKIIVQKGFGIIIPILSSVLPLLTSILSK